MSKRQDALEKIDQLLNEHCNVCTKRSPTHFAQTDKFCRKECDIGQKLQDCGKILEQTIKQVREDRHDARVQNQTRRQAKLDKIAKRRSEISKGSHSDIRRIDGGDMQLWLG